MATSVGEIEATLRLKNEITAELHRIRADVERSAKDLAIAFEAAETGVAHYEQALRELSGIDVVSQANAYAEALKTVGGASALTATEQSKVNAVVNEAIAKYEALGTQAPKALRELADATKMVANPMSSLEDHLTGIQQHINAFSGDKIIQEATQVARAVEQIGGASKLTAAEQQRVNAVVTEAISKYQALGQTAPQMLVKLAEATKAASAPFSDLKAHLAEVQRLTQEFSGQNIIQQAAQISQAVTNIGGASKLTAAEQAHVNQVVTEALQKYQALGQEAPQALKQLAAATAQVEKPTSGLAKVFGEFGQQVKATLLGFVGAQAIIAGVQTAFRKLDEFITDSVKAFSEAEAASRKLGAALKAQGSVVPNLKDQYDDLAKQFERTTVFSDDLITQMEALLVQVGDVMPFQMDRALEAVTDLASGLGIDLRQATMLVGKAFAGETDTLKRYGIIIDEAKLKTEGINAVLDEINDKFGGQAQAAVDSYSGKIQQLANAWNNLQEAVGARIAQDETVQFSIREVTKLLNEHNDALSDASDSEANAAKNTRSFSETLSTIHLPRSFADLKSQLQEIADAATATPPAFKDVSKAADDLQERFGNLTLTNDPFIESLIAMKDALDLVAEEANTAATALDMLKRVKPPKDFGKPDLSGINFDPLDVNKYLDDQDKMKKAAEAHLKVIKDLREEITGGGAIKAANDLMEALGRITQPKGLLEQGNLDLLHRPKHQNEDGSVSTVLSMGIENDNKQVLIPRINLLGQLMTEEEAVREFYRTGGHLGKFDTIKNANDYAEALHKQQAELYGNSKALANITDDQQMFVAVSKKGLDVSELTVAAQKKIHDTLTDAIQVYTALHQWIPQNVLDLYNATKATFDSSKANAELSESFDKQFDALQQGKLALNDWILGTKDNIELTGVWIRLWTKGIEVTDGLGKGLQDVGEHIAVDTSLIDKMNAEFEDHLRLLDAIAAGFNILGDVLSDVDSELGHAAQSIGGMVTQFTNLKDAIERFKDANIKANGQAALSTGQWAQVTMGAIGLVVTGVQTLKGLFEHLGIGGASDADRQLAAMKKSAIEAAGGLTQLRLSLQQAGFDADMIFKSKDPATFAMRLAQAQKAAEEMAGSMERLGLTWRDLNQSIRQSNITAITTQLFVDFRNVTAAGASTEKAIKGMSGALSQLVIDAKQTGTKIPGAMKPILEQLIRMGGLTEEAAAALLGVADDGVPALDDVRAAAERYGLTLDQLGGKVKQLEINEIASQLAADFKTLTASGADVNVVLNAMKDQVQKVVTSALTLGLTIPESMKPLIQAMIDAGLLTDQFGTKLVDTSGIQFAKPLSEKFDELIEKIGQLIDVFIDMGDEAEHQFNRARGAAEKLGTAIPRGQVGGGGTGGGSGDGGGTGGTGGTATPRPPKGSEGTPGAPPPSEDFPQPDIGPTLGEMAANLAANAINDMLQASSTPTAVDRTAPATLLSGAAAEDSGTTTVIIEADGRALAELIVPHIPDAVKRYGLA